MPSIPRFIFALLFTLPVYAQIPAATKPAARTAPNPMATQTPKLIPGAPNMAPDLLLPAETHWNHFSPEWIPDFKIPERLDPVLGIKVPVKFFIWHQPGRNMFQSGKETTDAERWENERKTMFNKGITAIIHTATRPDDFKPQGTLKTVPVNPFTQLSVGLGTTNDDAFRNDWKSWIGWWHKNVDEFAGVYNVPKKDGKACIFLTLPDYESTHAHGNDQTSTNYLTSGTYAMLEKSAGYVGQMYFGPTHTLGYVTEDHYKGGSKTHAWFATTDNTVPEPYRGKKISGNPRIIGGLEVSHHFETSLPEGHMMKDQHGKDWMKLTHFGKEPTAEHWAARVGGNIEVAQQYTRPVNQKLLAMIKVTADRQSGFKYEKDLANSHQGRWIQEFNRYGAIHQGPNNTEFIGPIGSEVITNFIAEAQYPLAYFCGADGINFWGSSYSGEFHPAPKQNNPRRGEKHSDPKYGMVDREPYNYVLKSLWRMNQKIKLENGQALSFFDICDGTEEYLNWETTVSYDDGKTFRKTRALDWQLDKLTAVRAVINRQKKVIFILALQPYGVEQKQVIVRFQEGMYTFQKRVDVPAGKVVICAYALNGIAPKKPTIK